jgi:hypothetical protein
MSRDKEDAFDREVRRVVYGRTAGEGRVPSAAEVAAALGSAREEARASFARLAAAHVLVLQGEGGEILMAAPFAAVPTPFLVESGGREYYGNCVWDALGIPVVLGRDARVAASCGCCGTSMELAVRGGALEAAEGVVHFALPAARWWDDVVFT